MVTYNPPIYLGKCTPKLSVIGDLLHVTHTQALDTSYLTDIVTAVQSAMDGPSTGAIDIDLGNGAEWWHSRLFVVASVAEDYTNVGGMVFHATRAALKHAFVGIAPPRWVRLCLARVTPQLQTAYSTAQASLPDAIDNLGLLPLLIGQFRLNLGAPEEALKLWTSEALITHWLGMRMASTFVPWSHALNQPADIRTCR